MKKLSPLRILLIGSTATFLCCTTLFMLLPKFVYSSPFLLFTACIFLAIVTFTIHYFLFKKFIHTRLKLLYRSIRTGKLNDSDDIKMNMSVDIIGEAKASAQIWAEERKSEISQLKEQDKFRREFLGNLAHELKTPVFSIQGYVLTLLEGGLEDDKVNRVFLERASKAIDRMTNILEDLDEMTKMEVNELNLEIRPFDIRELAKEVIDSFEIKANEKQIRVSFSKEDNSPLMVKADRGKIAQVLTNLIDNSINYGNINGHTQVRFYPIDDLITIEVSDNGPGIDPKHIPRLFERFYRVEQSRNRNEGGSGLGLSIVKYILELHNQTISVRSTVGIGSTFTFSLDKFYGSPNTLVSSRGVTIK